MGGTNDSLFLRTILRPTSAIGRDVGLCLQTVSVAPINPSYIVSLNAEQDDNISSY